MDKSQLKQLHPLQQQHVMATNAQTAHTSSMSSRSHHSHTRTNSSSSSASSIINSPIYADTSHLMFNNFSSAYPVSTYHAYSDKTPSEAAAVAAVKGHHHINGSSVAGSVPNGSVSGSSTVAALPAATSRDSGNATSSTPAPYSKIATPTFHHAKSSANRAVSPQGPLSPPLATHSSASAAANAAVFGSSAPVKTVKESKLSKANKLFGRPIKGIPSSKSKTSVPKTTGIGAVSTGLNNSVTSPHSRASQPLSSSSKKTGRSSYDGGSSGSAIHSHALTSNSASATVSQVMNHISHIGATPPTRSSTLDSISSSTHTHTPSGSTSSATNAPPVITERSNSLSSIMSPSRSSISSSRKLKLDLTVQTSLSGKSTLSEKSPLSRPSRELDRIAHIAPVIVESPGKLDSISNGAGSTAMSSKDSLKPLPTSSMAGSTKTLETPPSKLKSHGKHHLSFRNRKESYGLSSSASNSKLVFAEQGSIYSFHPSSPGVTVSPVELRSLPKDEREQVLDGSWSLLQTKVLPLFSGQEIRVPVEDLNNLLSMHISVATQNDATSARETLVQEAKDLLVQGMLQLQSISGLATDTDTGVSPSVVVDHLVSVWQQTLLEKIAPYMEAVLLPLVTELDSTISPRNLVLQTFRDVLFMPIIDSLKEFVSKPLLFDLSNNVSQTAARLFQCINILALLQTADANQSKIDSLVRIVKSSWISLPRQGKDRRGFVAASTLMMSSPSPAQSPCS